MKFGLSERELAANAFLEWRRGGVMSIQLGSVSVGDPKRNQSTDVGKTQALDLNKQAGVAQATAKAVHESLARIGFNPSVAPSAQVSVDASQIARLSGLEKVKVADNLDTAKLDELKAQIQDGSFKFDYGKIASQLIEHSVQQRGSKRG